jgi:hypothetical protein
VQGGFFAKVCSALVARRWWKAALVVLTLARVLFVVMPRSVLGLPGNDDATCACRHGWAHELRCRHRQYIDARPSRLCPALHCETRTERGLPRTRLIRHSKQ